MTWDVSTEEKQKIFKCVKKYLIHAMWLGGEIINWPTADCLQYLHILSDCDRGGQWAQCIDCSWSWRWCEPDNIKMWLQMLSGCCPSLSAASLSPLCRCSVGHRGNGPVAVVEFLDWHWYYNRTQCTERPSLCWKLLQSMAFKLKNSNSLHWQQFRFY